MKKKNGNPPSCGLGSRRRPSKFGCSGTVARWKIKATHTLVHTCSENKVCFRRY